MNPNDYNTTLSTVIDESASLRQFYLFTNQLSRNKKVRFVGKMDEADNIEWNFKYRGYPLTLQYNIYNGITLSQLKGKGLKVVNEVAIILKNKSRQ